MAVPFILSGTTVTVVVDMTPHAIAASHPNYARIKELAGNKATTEDMIRPLLDIPKTILDYTAGKVYVKNGKLFLSGCEVRTSLAAMIMSFIRQGQNDLAEPLKRFLENVAQNPDPRAQQDLFDWIQAAKLPITTDGYVLGWKAVTDDYRSIHAPTDQRFDHRIGKRVEQPRDECDANPDVTCSQGLHFCAATYLKQYAGGGRRVVVVKIHPKDVVAFPKDYNLAKGRACGYDVVGEVPMEKVADFYPQGAPVYRGFDKVTPTFEPLVVGQVYRRRDGGVDVVTRIDTFSGDRIARTALGRNVFVDTGRANRANELDRDYDLMSPVDFDLTAEDFHVGDRWINRSGKTVKIVKVNELYVELDEHGPLWRDNGRNWTRDLRRTGETDLVFNLDYGKRRAKFAVGDVWESRNGQQVTLRVVDGDGNYPIKGSNGADFTAEGLYHSGTRSSVMDLVKKIR